jgi:hypothetical protein
VNDECPCVVSPNLDLLHRGFFWVKCTRLGNEKNQWSVYKKFAV